MPAVKIKEVVEHLETMAPKAYQESYDNSGLILGDPDQEVTGILVTLDCIEEVVDEALSKGCNLIVAHHPILFKGLKKLTGSNYVERTLLKAIRNGIGIYAIHTNLDNVHSGVNKKIAEKVGLKNLRILAPKANVLSKLVTFVPAEHTGTVLDALHRAGAGQIGNYQNCSFQVKGTGSFKPNEDANPKVGTRHQQEFVDETRIEVILPSHIEKQAIAALKAAHPYEEVAYYLHPLSNENQEVGSGMVGELEQEAEPMDFLIGLKKSMDLKMIRHTRLLNKPVKKVAVCGGSGSFLLKNAISAGAQVFITADFKYHEFFDAENRIIIADIGHYESEAFTGELLKEVLMKKFRTFAINFSSTVTNPISYL
jgi:dinuclear metal center YbgI/SA1388 family protein